VVPLAQAFSTVTIGRSTMPSRCRERGAIPGSPKQVQTKAASSGGASGPPPSASASRTASATRSAALRSGCLAKREVPTPWIAALMPGPR
jgi:hypothetical protein